VPDRAEVPREAIWRSPRWISYPLADLSLSPEGYLRTGLYRILKADNAAREKAVARIRAAAGAAVPKERPRTA
jgi:hypothetical protein